MLQQLLQYSKLLDEKIKTTQNYPIWDAFEKLALRIGLGNKVIEQHPIKGAV